jgi:hypothetical protein
LHGDAHAPQKGRDHPTLGNPMDMTVGMKAKQVPLDDTAAFDRQDVAFTSAIREGREPESSARSCLPTMVLLDRIDEAMQR